MTARCHEDSCSIEWSEVTTLSGPAYSAAAILNPDDPSLECVEDAGLQVMLNASVENIITRTSTGLLANLPNAVVTTLSGNPANNGVSPSADDGSAQDSDTYSWTNSTGRDALVLVSGEFNFLYGILGPTHAYSYSAGNGVRAGRIDASAYDATGAGAAGDDTAGAQLVPFNAQLAMRLLANVNAAPTTSRKACRVGIGGMINVSNPAGAEQKIERVPFFWMVRVPDGDTLNMKSEAFYEGPSQTVNVAAAPGIGTGMADTGHELWNLQVAAIPI